MGRVEENIHASILAYSAKPNPDFNGFLDYNIDVIDVAICQLAIRIRQRNVNNTDDILGPRRHRTIRIIRCIDNRMGI